MKIFWNLVAFITCAYSLEHHKTRQQNSCVQCTVCSVQYAVYNVQYIQCTVYTVKCTMYSKVVLLILWRELQCSTVWGVKPFARLCFASPLKRSPEQLSGTSKWSKIWLSGHRNGVKFVCRGHRNAVKFGCRGHQNRVKFLIWKNENQFFLENLNVQF